MSFINLFGSNVSGEGAGDNPAGWAHEWGAANWSAYAQELVDVVRPDVLCFDHYPVFGRVASDAARGCQCDSVAATCGNRRSIPEYLHGCTHHARKQQFPSSFVWC